MKKFLLGAFFPGQKLNIVDQQDIDAAILVAEINRFIVADGIDQFIGKLLRRGIHDLELRIMLQGVMPDSVHQMCFSQPNASINEKRVVSLGNRLGHGQRGGVSETVAVSNHKCFKNIFRIEIARPEI